MIIRVHTEIHVVIATVTNNIALRGKIFDSLKKLFTLKAQMVYKTRCEYNPFLTYKPVFKDLRNFVPFSQYTVLVVLI